MSLKNLDMRSNYRKIGDLIELVDERNKALEVKNLLGVSINKTFIPSVANTVGTNMGNYKIIRKGQFAVSLMQVRRDKKIPAALYREESPSIVSQAYPVFQVKENAELLPAYLMMWMSRSEFDRETCFHAVGGVRGSLEWEDFCNLELPVPSIEKQREIVREYEVITDRIALNEKMSEKLEETAQALYKHWFVDFEFPMPADYAESIGKPELIGKPYKSNGGEMKQCEELDKEIPIGFKSNTILEISFSVKSGGTPLRSNNSYWFEGHIPWIKTGEISNTTIYQTEELITEAGLNASSAKLIPKGSVLVAMYGDGKTKGQCALLSIEAATNQACAAIIPNGLYDASYIYHFFRYNYENITSVAIGGAQENLSKGLIEGLKLIDPKTVSTDLIKTLAIIDKYRSSILKSLIQLVKFQELAFQKLAS